MNPAFVAIEKLLKKKQTHFTLNEAAAATGLSVDEARSALDELIKKYVCRLQVTENGDLIYDFGKHPRRRGHKTFSEKMAVAGGWLWKLFTWLSKAWIAITLVVYFVIFLVILVMVIMTVAGSNRGRKGSSLNLGRLAELFYVIFRWQTHTGQTSYRQDRRGYPYRRFEPRPAVMNEKKKSFIASVYDFVFGPEHVQVDPLVNQKEVAAYARRHQGIVVPAELNALAGWNFPEAETFLSDCLVRFNGRIDVSENGVMYGRFDELLRGVGKIEEGEIVHYWDEYEPEYEVTGNSSSRNILIAAMNGFNLFFSGLVVFGTLYYDMGVALFAPHNWFALLALGWLPMVFSTLFFIIPVVRIFRTRQKQQRRRRNNVRKRLYKVIFQSRGQYLTSEAMQQAANRNARQEEQLTTDTVDSLLRDLALDMPGDTTVSESGEVVYGFPRVGYELDEAGKLRAERKPDADLGRVIVDSD